MPIQAFLLAILIPFCITILILEFSGGSGAQGVFEITGYEGELKMLENSIPGLPGKCERIKNAPNGSC
jgi:hypothetical protein